MMKTVEFTSSDCWTVRFQYSQLNSISFNEP
jgi:hypothetical protein